MREDKRLLCHGIIHAASVSAGAVGAGLAQIPGSDNSIITPIQLGMIVSLGEVFNIELSESASQAALRSAIGSQIGRAVSQVLIGWIPGLGNIANAATAASITEAIGWSIANRFDNERR